MVSACPTWLSSHERALHIRLKSAGIESIFHLLSPYFYDLFAHLCFFARTYTYELCLLPASGTTLSCGLHKCPQRCHQLYDHSKKPCDFVLSMKCPKGHSQSWMCRKKPPTSCRKCDKDSEEEERRKRKALELKETRERAEREYDEQILKINEEIELRTQEVREKRLAQERQMTLQQRRKDLEGIADPAQRQNISQTQVPSTKKPNTQGRAVEKEPTKGTGSKADPPLDPHSVTTSQAKVEWERQKSLEKASNNAIDSLMDMVGLEGVKSQVLGIKAKIDVSLRQGSDVKDERFNVSLLGNPGTGKTLESPETVPESLLMWSLTRQDNGCSTLCEGPDISWCPPGRRIRRDYRLSSR